MQNFSYKNPTEILFGKGMIAELATRVPLKTPVLLLYGGGSIMRNGVYAQVKAALQQHRLVEFGGIEANPLFETCLKAVALVKKEKVKFILAVGGGSVLDAAKFIAAAALFKGRDPWAILETHGANVTAALPVGTVLTLPATGSESNGNAVISRATTQEKLHFTSALAFRCAPCSTRRQPSRCRKNSSATASWMPSSTRWSNILPTQRLRRCRTASPSRCCRR